MDEIQELQKFLDETNKELERKIRMVDEALDDIKSDVTESLQNTEKVLETTLWRFEDMNVSMKTFKARLVERNLMKSSVPQINVLGEDGCRKRDSGVASSISSASPQTSASRLSGVDDDGTDARNVSFNLLSTRTSLSEFGETEKTEDVDESQVVNPNEISTLYIHLLPSDPNIDLSALQEMIYNLSRTTVKSDKIQLHVVPSDSFIGITSRQTSVSSDGHTSVMRQSSNSSERLYSIRTHLPSSNESLTALINNLSQKTPLEHSDLSDENNSRLVSSSDSEISMARYRLHLNTVETQTEIQSEDNAIAGCPVQLKNVETQTD